MSAVNIYGALDNELGRMHELLKTYSVLADQAVNGHYPNRSTAHNDMAEIYKRIAKIQDVLLTTMISSDKEYQEKVAELALTGTKDNES